jgi:hypothetical protein
LTLPTCYLISQISTLVDFTSYLVKTHHTMTTPWPWHCCCIIGLLNTEYIENNHGTGLVYRSPWCNFPLAWDEGEFFCPHLKQTSLFYITRSLEDKGTGWKGKNGWRC